MLTDCKNTQDDLKAIEAWATIFTNKAQLVAQVTKNYLLHKKAVKADIAGFIYGMTGDNDLVEIEACFQANQEMYEFINLAIGDLKKEAGTTMCKLP